MLIPEPARQRVHQSHRAPGEFVAGRGRDQDIEALVEPHEGDVVGLGGGREHGFRHFGEFAAFLRRGALGRQARHQPLQLAPHLEQPQLQPQIDLGDHDAAPRHDHDQPVPRQPLQGFPDRGPADLQANRKRLLRQHRSRRQLQRDDHLFEFAIGAIGQRAVLGLDGPRPAFRWRFRFQIVPRIGQRKGPGSGVPDTPSQAYIGHISWSNTAGRLQRLTTGFTKMRQRRAPRDLRPGFWPELANSFPISKAKGISQVRIGQGRPGSHSTEEWLDNQTSAPTAA